MKVLDGNQSNVKYDEKFIQEKRKLIYLQKAKNAIKEE
jgi:hypothetical protein